MCKIEMFVNRDAYTLVLHCDPGLMWTRTVRFNLFTWQLQILLIYLFETSLPKYLCLFVARKHVQKLPCTKNGGIEEDKKKTPPKKTNQIYRHHNSPPNAFHNLLYLNKPPPET